MIRAFVDESYSEDWFFMAAAITTEPRQLSGLQSSFAQLLRSESERLAIPCPPEVHGYELFQGRDMWGDVRVHERMAIAAKVIDLMESAGIQFIVRGIDRGAQRRRYRTAFHPYPMVLTHIAQQVDEFASDRGEKARIVCDEYEEHDRHRAMLNRHRISGAPTYKGSKLPNIDGELQFVRSHDSALIQAADIVAYLRHRIACNPRPAYRERRTRDHLWSKVDRMLIHDYCWRP